MAKVMVSLPDELLADLDEAACREGDTRSGYLRRIVQAHLQRRSHDRAEQVTALLAATPAGHRGGDVAGVVEAHRPKR